MSKKSVSLSGERTTAFVLFWDGHVLVVFALSLLCMESNAFISRFFYKCSFDDLMNIHNLWSCGSTSPKTVLIFPKNFLDFRSDTIEKQNVINLNGYGCKIYGSVAFGDSKVSSFGEGNDAVFRAFLCCILFITQHYKIEQVCHQNVLVSQTSKYHCLPDIQISLSPRHQKMFV